MTPWLIVGLGNPGRDYAQNRHNIGFMAADALADKYGVGGWKNLFQSQIHSATIDGATVFLQKPQTYMNLSGEAVGAAMRYYKIPVENVIVIHDEIDLPFHTARIKQGGGSGGHNGLKSIDQHCDKNYWRIRLGVGHPGDKDRVSDHVLSDFSKDEHAELEDWLQDLTARFPLMLQGQATQLAGILTKKETVKEEKDGI